MADLAQLDLKARGGEARLRGLLEDLTETYLLASPQGRLALAVWFGKSPQSHEQHLLQLFSGLPAQQIAQSRFSLLWKAGSSGAPFVNVVETSVDYFSKLLDSSPEQAEAYRQNYEVLYFDKKLLGPQVLEWFQVINEPAGLIKGWFVSATEYEMANENVQTLLSAHAGSRPEIGLIKVEESPDFENCRGLLHVEVSQKWLPLSPEGIGSYVFYRDQPAKTYFLFEGGALYRVLKFEVKTAPEYASRLLGKTRDDRYPEVYLRAVHPPARTAA
jgi:hypothetical protein